MTVFFRVVDEPFEEHISYDSILLCMVKIMAGLIELKETAVIRM